MKRIVMLLMVVILAMAVGSTFALPNIPSGKQHSGSGSYNSNNCAGEYSAQVTHNGSVVSHQNRKDEVRNLQDCNNANQK